MESFFSNLIRRPFKLFMLCSVLYVASQSFIVGFFVAVVALHHLYRLAFAPGKASVTGSQASVAAASTGATPAATARADAEPSYERSAVVTPIRRAGTSVPC
ncbi:hypothetical protein [Cupriavidus sp. AU9028]|uniref:hypothetical protein n=1 Tax=Cupriavidus sp. AU9028 TaxID=2871157 RepID=UPI001C95D329|nr:hypothetical protein [Cupriavidus sp. AU9028]MBY4898662.1 hypothetical protein [Cupriavidus sp. AU9028]